MTLIMKKWLVPGTALAAAALLAACSSSSSSTTGPLAAAVRASTAASATSPADSGVALAQQTVTKLEATTSSYPVPTASVPGVSKLKGRTVFYIPLLQDVPTFAVAAQTMKAALARAGLKLQVCDGQAQPTAVAACVQQAVGAGAAGIVLDAIPYGMAYSALNAAVAKGVPVLVADQVPRPARPTPTGVSYLPGAQDQASQIAWWTIADSDGKANGIIAEEIDNPSSIAAVTDSLAIYKKYCPACVITVKQISASTTALEAAAPAPTCRPTRGTYYYTNSKTASSRRSRASSRTAGLRHVPVRRGGSVDGLGLLKGDPVVKAVVVVDQAFEGGRSPTRSCG